MNESLELQLAEQLSVTRKRRMEAAEEVLMARARLQALEEEEVRLESAHAALTGQAPPARVVLEDPAVEELFEAPPPPAPPTPPPPPPPEPQVVDTRPDCPSCGSGKLNFTHRQLSNGKIAPMYICGECGHQQL